MGERDSWQERYLSLVPEKLTAAEVRLLLDLWIEDPYRLQRALQAFVAHSAHQPEDEADA